MTVQSVNLWPPDFGERTDLLTPLTILRQQGTLLGERTQNIVVGRVTTGGDTARAEREVFSHSFSLYCSPLGFHTNLLVVFHGIEPYPARVIVIGEEGRGKTAGN